MYVCYDLFWNTGEEVKQQFSFYNDLYVLLLDFARNMLNLIY